MKDQSTPIDEVDEQTLSFRRASFSLRQSAAHIVVCYSAKPAILSVCIGGVNGRLGRCP